MRYQKTLVKIWNEPTFHNFSPLVQRFYFYITTNPHTNFIGLYILREGYVLEDLDCSKKEFDQWINTLSDAGFIRYCHKTKILFIKDYLKHNPIQMFLTELNQTIQELLKKYQLIKD